MAKTIKRGLGRGLNALFGDDLQTSEPTGQDNAGQLTGDLANNSTGAKQTASDNLQNMQTTMAAAADVSRETSVLPIALIEPNRSQPRKRFDEESLGELAESIKIHGILQPILVRKTGATYEILVGERRWRAARLAGLQEIPVIIKDLENQEAAEIAIIENIQRENLNSVEEAMAFRTLIEEYQMTQEELAGRVSKSRSAITNSLRLLQLDQDVLQLLSDGDISAGHARALLGISGKRAQYKAAREVVNNGLSVRDTEKLVKNWQKEKKPKKQKEADIYLTSLAEDLTGALGTRVRILPSGTNKGKIEIEYYTLEDLESLSALLRG